MSKVDRLIALAADARGNQSERLAALAKLDAMGVEIVAAPVFTHEVNGIDVTEDQGRMICALAKEKMEEAFRQGVRYGKSTVPPPRSLFDRIFG